MSKDEITKQRSWNRFFSPITDIFTVYFSMSGGIKMIDEAVLFWAAE